MNESEPDPCSSALTVAEVAARCQKEMAAKDERPPRLCCHELFRRAIVAGNQDAWAAIHAQYHALLRYWAWLPPHSDDLAQEAFVRFSEAITPERFAQGTFPNTARLLAYMRVVAKNARNNMLRRLKGEQIALKAWGETQLARGTISDWEHVERQQLWGYLRRLVPDEVEWLVLTESYEFGLKPGAIALRHPERFQSSEDVSTIKERLKKRLAGDPLLRKYL